MERKNSRLGLPVGEDTDVKQDFATLEEVKDNMRLQRLESVKEEAHQEFWYQESSNDSQKVSEEKDSLDSASAENDHQIAATDFGVAKDARSATSQDDLSENSVSLHRQFIEGAMVPPPEVIMFEPFAMRCQTNPLPSYGVQELHGLFSQPNGGRWSERENSVRQQLCNDGVKDTFGF